jgi:hypothetical protein
MQPNVLGVSQGAYKEKGVGCGLVEDLLECSRCTYLSVNVSECVYMCVCPRTQSKSGKRSVLDTILPTKPSHM